MLRLLHIKNFAIIDRLEVELETGLNVVTGETGAGKSILVAALQLVLGAKGRSEVVRTGEDHALVEALFEIGEDATLKTKLADAGVDCDDELIVRRILRESGRTRAYLNDRLSAAGQLVELAPGLADISSQHQAHTLVDASTHLGYLDAFGAVDKELSAMRHAYTQLSRATTELRDLQAAAHNRLEREDLLRFQLMEIDELKPVEGELLALETERQKLRHAERLATAAASAEEALYAADRSICGTLGRIVNELSELSTLDPQLEPVVSTLTDSQTQLQEAARDLGSYAREITFDPARLDTVEERMARLKRMQRKYGGSLGQVLAKREQAAEELASLEHYDARIDAAREALGLAEKSASVCAQALRTRRMEAAGRLGDAISVELRTLGMGDAEVVVEVASQDERRGTGLEIEGMRLSETGTDRVEFLIAPNKGEKARPLRNVASGGELSRAMLAIKRVLGNVGPGGLYVFDEVDSGVGGAVAEVLGRKLAEVARHRQVLCITHLAQIAVYADAHFRVHKEVCDGRTRSTIVRLTEGERQEEIARMLGGVTVTDRTRAAATDMMSAAEQARSG
ncbi:MAG: DNA repair protein RecN [Myxococcota bacterium]